MRVLMVLAGRGRCTRPLVPAAECTFVTGDVVLVPAEAADLRLELHADSEFLEVVVEPGPPGKGPL